MRLDKRHLSDEELLSWLDHELSRRRKAAVESHLAACRACRERSTELQTASTDFENCHRMLDNALAPAKEPRAVLKARLAELASVPPQRSWTERLQPVLAPKRWIYVTAALLAAVSAAVLQFSTLSVAATSTPDAALTPGLVRPVSAHDICSGDGGDAPAVTQSIAHDVFRQYGIRDPKPRTYEVDYLITPALGGAHDVRNLWPQPYSQGTWNAHVKDALEDHLYQLVCRGKVDLETAQRDISINWISAYKKYFQSEEPLPSHMDFRKDPPWE